MIVILNGEPYWVTTHTVEEMNDDGITFEDIEEVLRTEPQYVHPIHGTLQFTKRIGDRKTGYVLRVAITEEHEGFPRRIVTVSPLGE